MQGIVTRKQYDSHRDLELTYCSGTGPWCRITLNNGQTCERWGHEANFLNMFRIGQEFLMRNGQILFGRLER